MGLLRSIIWKRDSLRLEQSLPKASGPISFSRESSATSQFTSVASVLDKTPAVAPPGNFPPFITTTAVDAPMEHKNECRLHFLIHAETVAALDARHGRLPYFSKWHPELLRLRGNQGHPMQLAINPGTYVSVHYRNSQQEPQPSLLTGVVTDLCDNGGDSWFKLFGVANHKRPAGEHPVIFNMRFLTFSPLIAKIEILRRSVWARSMRYLMELEDPALLVYSQSELPEGKEVIGEETAQLPLEKKIANRLPLQTPKGYRPEGDMDQVDRFASLL